MDLAIERQMKICRPLRFELTHKTRMLMDQLLRACRMQVGHSTHARTVRNFSIEVDDIIDIAETFDICVVDAMPRIPDMVDGA